MVQTRTSAYLLRVKREGFGTWDQRGWDDASEVDPLRVKLQTEGGSGGPRFFLSLVVWTSKGPLKNCCQSSVLISVLWKHSHAALRVWMFPAFLLSCCPCFLQAKRSSRRLLGKRQSKLQTCGIFHHLNQDLGVSSVPRTLCHATRR